METRTDQKTDQYATIRKLERFFRQVMGSDRFALRRELNRLKRFRSGKAGAFEQKARELEKRIRRSVDQRAWREANRPRPAYNEELPIVSKKDEIIRAIQDHPVVVISGETGSGKTTQIPKFCLEAGRGIDGKIGCTQPRRIAAITVASRIAEELGGNVGDAVGYKIRFQDQTGDRGFIKIMTDGILLAEAQGDRWLNEYDTLIVDEAHERSLNIDFVLGILKTLVRRRKNLKLIITSATIDTEKFSRAFDDAPVIEVSGRTYPVDVRYMPPEDTDDDQTHVEMAVRAVDRLQQESPYGGDILVFMPTEQDIRETCELLDGRNHTGVTVMPLFARLAAGEQSRVFSPVRGRKVIVATNVAETSITIPGIHYVVDTGLARISQYSPRTRTTGLPVEPVARSSADQRKGRCGRVANGICIRLYSEEDYENRPRFTPPEILRSNLAEVILRMIALRLGDVENFPFIDRPADKNIRDGFNLLEELGAITRTDGKKGPSRYVLTDRGRTMAAMPIDPRLSRMLLEAADRGCLAEMIVIASALSIPDPRERPSEKEAQADQAHARFKDRRSDFMALLNIWREYHQAWQERRSMGKIRKYCKENFLSFKRMREWRDIHQQLAAELEENGIPMPEQRPGQDSGEGFTPLYTAIHQSILSGFLSNIAMKKEKYIYRAARDREVMLFPGSGLFNSGGPWVVAAEMVETSRLFARTVASIDVEWLEEIGKDQCRSTFLDPHWERNRGEVVAFEQVSLYGLIIVPRRPVSYGPIDPETSRQIFIQSALVEGDMKQSFPFIRHNRALIDEVQEMEDRTRRRDLLVSPADLEQFYQERIDQPVYDVRTLKQFLKRRKSDRFLRMQQEDLLRTAPDRELLSLYPEKISLGNTVFPCEYAFDPGNAADGVTIHIPSDQASSVPAEAVDWVVPGLFREKVETLIKSLPKAYRKQLVPVSNTVEIIAGEMDRTMDRPLITALSQFIHRRFGVNIPASAWDTSEIPDYLKMRLSIRGPKGEELRAGRDPVILNQGVSNAVDPDGFQSAREAWERTNVTGWDFPDLPDAVTLKGAKGEKWVAYPGLKVEKDDSLSLHLFRNQTEAVRSHRAGMVRLFAIHFSGELRSLKKQLTLPRQLDRPARYFGGAKAVESQLYDSFLDGLFRKDIRAEEQFQQHGEAVRPTLVDTARKKLTAVVRVIEAYHESRSMLYDLENANRTNPAAIRFLSDLRDDLARLVPENFVSLYDTDRLAHLERYIKALTLRAERGLVSFEKDRSKAQEVEIQTRRLGELLNELSASVSADKRQAVEEFFWLIEEYKVSLYAQELKTPVPVSPKRLGKRYEEIRRMA